MAKKNDRKTGPKSLEASKRSKPAGGKSAAERIGAGADRLKEAVGKMDESTLQSVYRIIMSEKNEFVLNRQSREILRDSLGADVETADSWRTTADVVKRFDSAELFRKYPDQAKNVLVGVLSVIPITSIAAGFVNEIPAETLSKVLNVPLSLTPEHMLRVIAEHQAIAAEERRSRYLSDPPAEEGKRDLVMVCKDARLTEQLKTLVETNDDEGEDAVIGVKDGTVRLLVWDEKKWLYRSRMDLVDSKALIVGDVDGIEESINMTDVRFEKHGVRYGWHGDMAFIKADRAALRSKAAYSSFLAELGELPVPCSIGKNSRLSLNLKTGLKLALATPLIVKDIYDDSKAVTRQMYFYGLMRFYYDNLEAFLGE